MYFTCFCLIDMFMRKEVSKLEAKDSTMGQNFFWGCISITCFLYRYYFIPLLFNTKTEKHENQIMYDPLKYGFCEKSLLYEWNSDQLPLFFFFYHFWLGLLLHPTKSDKKMKKGATGQSFLFPKCLLTKSILYLPTVIEYLLTYRIWIANTLNFTYKV